MTRDEGLAEEQKRRALWRRAKTFRDDAERTQNEQQRNDRLYGFGRHAADRWGLALLLALGVNGCTVPLPEPQIEAAIRTACVYSGLFEQVDAFGTLVPVPGVSFGIGLLNAGVDKVCSDPARYAGDISTIEWLLAQFRAHPKGTAT